MDVHSPGRGIECLQGDGEQLCWTHMQYTHLPASLL